MPMHSVKHASAADEGDGIFVSVGVKVTNARSIPAAISYIFDILHNNEVTADASDAGREVDGGSEVAGDTAGPRRSRGRKASAKAEAEAGDEQPDGDAAEPDGTEGDDGEGSRDPKPRRRRRRSTSGGDEASGDAGADEDEKPTRTRRRRGKQQEDVSDDEGEDEPEAEEKKPARKRASRTRRSSDGGGDSGSAGEADADPEPLTLKDVSRAASAAGAIVTPAVVMECLEAFGAKLVNDLDPKHYSRFVAELDKAIEEAQEEEGD